MSVIDPIKSRERLFISGKRIKHLKNKNRLRLEIKGRRSSKQRILYFMLSKKRKKNYRDLCDEKQIR